MILCYRSVLCQSSKFILRFVMDMFMFHIMHKIYLFEEVNCTVVEHSVTPLDYSSILFCMKSRSICFIQNVREADSKIVPVLCVMMIFVSVRLSCFTPNPTNDVNGNLSGEFHFNPLKPELNPICYLLALLGSHHFLHVSRIRVKLLTFRLLMS